MICTFHLYIKEDLYFAPKIKRSNIFWEIQWLGHLRNKKKRLGLYFSLLIGLVLKYFQIRVSNKVNWKGHLKGVFFSKRTLTTSVLSACQMFAKCIDDPQVLELLQKYFVRIKTAKQITAISHENRAKNWKKKTAATILKKERLIRCWICLSTQNNVNEKSLTVFEATELDCSKVFLTKATSNVG